VAVDIEGGSGEVGRPVGTAAGRLGPLVEVVVPGRDGAPWPELRCGSRRSGRGRRRLR
jgi:hypothetical protein